MPASKKGKTLLAEFKDRYGKERGKSVAFATANKQGKKSGLYKALHGGRKK